MEILSINAENTLANLASSIGRDPETWEGWSCLYIEIASAHSKTESFVWAKSIIESYLQNAEGRVFFCNDKDIYIICKDVSFDNLEHVGALICDFILSEEGTFAQYIIYNLSQDGFRFSNGFFETLKLSSPLSEMSEESRNRLHELMLSRLLKQTSKVNSYIAGGYAKVLLIEDDPVTRWMVRNALKDECDFATASEAHKAFDMYASYQPDVVFLDINLPDTNGYDVLQWIMHNDPGANVVMFSSNGNLDNIANSMAQGARGFITKPFSKRKLLHYLRMYTGSASYTGVH